MEQIPKTIPQRQWLDAYADEHELRLLTADGFDEAILGVVYRKGMETVTLYDRGKCIRILMTRDGMSEEEADEFFAFNVEDAWVGEATPAWAMLINK
jgi:hypothetical protein